MLGKINRPQSFNGGSITKVYIADHSLVNDIPADADGILSEDVTFASNGGFVEFEFTEDTGQYKCDAAKLGDNGYYKHEVVFSLPKMRSQSVDLLTKMTGKRFLLVCKLHNGLYYLVGVKDVGLRFSFTSDTQTTSEDKNGHDLMFEAIHISKAIEYTGAITMLEDQVVPFQLKMGRFGQSQEVTIPQGSVPPSQYDPPYANVLRWDGASYEPLNKTNGGPELGAAYQWSKMTTETMTLEEVEFGDTTMYAAPGADNDFNPSTSEHIVASRAAWQRLKDQAVTDGDTNPKFVMSIFFGETAANLEITAEEWKTAADDFVADLTTIQAPDLIVLYVLSGNDVPGYIGKDNGNRIEQAQLEWAAARSNVVTVRMNQWPRGTDNLHYMHPYIFIAGQEDAEKMFNALAYPGVLFVPSDAPGLLVHVEADSGVTHAGGTVSQMDDLENSYDIVPTSTPADEPDYNATDATLNDLPTLSGDGVSQHLRNLSVPVGDVFTLYAVIKPTAVATGTHSVIELGGSVEMQYKTTGLRFRFNGGYFTSNIALVTDTWYAVCVSINADEDYHFEVKDITPQTGSIPAVLSGDRFSVFARQTGSAGFVGDFYMGLLYDQAHEEADRNKVFGYINRKTGL